MVSAALFTGGFLLTQNSIMLGPNERSNQEKVFEQWYARAAEASKKATRLAQKAQETLEIVKPRATSGPTLVAPSVVERLRGVSQILDTCQQDIYDELWVGLATYPGVFRGYVPLFNYYTDTAFPPGSPGSAVEQVRFALKYEVGRLARGIDDLEASVQRRSMRDVERAFADMSLAYDRYLKAGSLYAGYDPVTSTTVFYEGIDDSQLVYTPLSLEQPRIRDEVLVIQGPDKGKVGTVIWLGRNGPGNSDPDKVVSAVVKLNPNPILGGNSGWGVKEVKAYPYSWIAVTRTSQQSFQLDLILGGLAAIFSCGLTYPLDSLKSRIQSKLPLLPPEGLPGLFNGLTFNLLREVPNQAMYMAGFNFLTRQFCLLPFVDANNPSLKLLVMIPAGVLGFLSGSFFRAPFELLNRQLQTGQAKTDDEAIQNVFFKQPPAEVWENLQKSWVLCVFKGVPFGALQCTFYEFFKDRLELVQYGVPNGLQPFIWGAIAGVLTGVITNPPDVVLTRISKIKEPPPAAAEVPALWALVPSHSGASDRDSVNGVVGSSSAQGKDVLAQLAEAAAKINEEEGVAGFFRGAGARALYFAPEACLWFAAYEFLRSTADLISEL